MAQIRGAVVVNVIPGPDEGVEDYIEELTAFIEAAGAELGNVVQTAVEVVPAAEVIDADEDIAVASDPSVPDGDVVTEEPMDPLAIIEEAERIEEARYV